MAHRLAPTVAVYIEPMMGGNDMDHSRPNRRSIRLRDWDYRSAGFYFITICTYQRQHLFNDPRLKEMASNAWQYIPKQPHAKHVIVDESVIMPNHMHGILEITTDPEELLLKTAVSQSILSNSIGAIIGNYKMLVTKRTKAILKTTGSNQKVWQRGYWERIIRNERELQATRNYIQKNPSRWQEDRDNLDKLLGKMTYVDT